MLPSNTLTWLLLGLGFALPAYASQAGDPSAPLALMLALILVAAKLAGHVANRFGQPAVLGELLAGVVLGNVGLPVLTQLKADPSIDMLARLGVLLLLFEVGLESTVRQMLRVGWAALRVAVLGVIAPFFLGFLAAAWLLPDSSFHTHLFVGATLTATSVGITARVLQDLGKSQTDEARIILGAAVIDDVLGLILLAVVAASIAAAAGGAQTSAFDILAISAKAGAFLFGAIAAGVLLAPRLFRVASRLRGTGTLLATGLALCFGLAWAADAVGLAPIVGAFAAGLILEDAHYAEFHARGERGLGEMVNPVANMLVPVFFVLMGMRTDLRAFLQPGVISLAGVLIVCAVVGKQACALAVRGVDRLSVGVGMIPRGEVGLIFANIGLSLKIGGAPVVSPATYAALVAVVVSTTLVTPPLLKWSLARRRSPPPST